MTLMLASVADAAEAEIVARLGADIVDLKDPGSGALGAVPIEAARAAVAAAANACAISATLSDPPYDARPVVERAAALIDAGVDYLTIAVDADSLASLGPKLRRLADRTKLVGLMFADKSPDFALLEALAQTGFNGAMLDKSNKSRGRLLTHVGIAQLSDFVARCRISRLFAALAGSLEPPDIPRLQLVEPDVLGFRGALRRAHDRRAAIDPQAVSLVRDLIPHARQAGNLPPGANRTAFARGPSVGSEGDLAVETVYVRDFPVSADIGAYDSERGALQRVVFDVEAGVQHPGKHADDLRTIFSYDVILDAIRLAVGRGHVNLIETLAEDVAQMVLREPRVLNVRVSVRKPDVIAGAVGIEIRRERHARSADVPDAGAG